MSDTKPKFEQPIDENVSKDAAEATAEILGLTEGQWEDIENTEPPFGDQKKNDGEEKPATTNRFLFFEDSKKPNKTQRVQLVLTREMEEKLYILKEASHAPSLNQYVENIIADQYQAYMASEAYDPKLVKKVSSKLKEKNSKSK